MIIKTALNPHAGNLYRHLTRTDDGNEKIRVVEIRGCASDDLLGGLREMKATAAGSRCTKSFFHVSFAAPQADADRLQSDKTWLYCAQRFEEEFGLENHARAVVHHYKDGRWHQHVVWNRIDPETGRAAHLSHEHRRAVKIARELENTLQLTPVPSQRQTHRQGQRPPHTWETEAARRTKIDADLVRDEIRSSWQESDNGHAFANALESRGLRLARGEVRPYVVLDGAGNFYALGARVLPGESMRSILDRLDDVQTHLPTIEQARELQAEHSLADRHKRKKKGGKGGEGKGTLSRDYAKEHGALKRQYLADREALDKKHTEARKALERAHAGELRVLAAAERPGLMAKLTGAAKKQVQAEDALRAKIKREHTEWEQLKIAEQEALRLAHERAVFRLREQEREEKRRWEAAHPKPPPAETPAPAKPRRTAAKAEPRRTAAKAEPRPPAVPTAADPSAAREWEKQRQRELRQQREARQAEARAQRPSKGRGRTRRSEPE